MKRRVGPRGGVISNKCVLRAGAIPEASVHVAEIGLMDPPQDRIELLVDRCAKEQADDATRLTGVRPGLPGVAIGKSPARKTGRSLGKANLIGKFERLIARIYNANVGRDRTLEALRVVGIAEMVAQHRWARLRSVV